MSVTTAAERATSRSVTYGEALDEAFREHHAWLVKRLALVVGDPVEAEDLAQQVFVRAMEHRPTIEGGRAIRPWLASVGVNLAISERRRRTRWGFLPIRDTDRQWVMQADPDLWRALAKLQPRVRAALLLTVVDGFTQDEVARAMGVRRGTVASWLSRARAQIRPVLEETADDRR